MTRAHKPATYEALLGLPVDVKAEVIAGVVQERLASSPRHAKAHGAIRRFVGGPFDEDDGFGGPGGWWIFLEVDVQFSPHDILRPDLTGFRRTRLSDLDERPFTVIPDWVCEVISPSTARHDRVAKRRLYAAHGVKHYWLVDPETRTLEALELREGVWMEVGVYDEESVVRIRPFEEVELPIGRLFLPK
jgi:Uma2 family endonuclease